MNKICNPHYFLVTEVAILRLGGTYNAKYDRRTSRKVHHHQYGCIAAEAVSDYIPAAAAAASSTAYH
jgi:hypothetical protein